MQTSNKLILGTAQIGLDYGLGNSTGKISRAEAFEILKHAHENNILEIDTAAAYGDAESILGDFIHSQDEFRNYSINTKLDLQNAYSIKSSVIASTEKIKTPQIKTLYLHSLRDFLNLKKSEIATLTQLRGYNYLQLGISLYSNEEIIQIMDIGIFDVVQMPFNLLDNSSKREKIIQELKNRNIEIHTRSVFLQGVFFMDETQLPVFLKPLLKYLKTINEIVEDYRTNVGALAIQYSLNKPYIDKVIVGVDSLRQLRQNLKNTLLYVPEKALQEIDKIEVEQVDLLNPTKWNI